MKDTSTFHTVTENYLERVTETFKRKEKQSLSTVKAGHNYNTAQKTLHVAVRKCSTITVKFSHLKCCFIQLFY